MGRGPQAPWVTALPRPPGETASLLGCGEPSLPAALTRRPGPSASARPPPPCCSPFLYHDVPRPWKGRSRGDRGPWVLVQGQLGCGEWGTGQRGRRRQGDPLRLWNSDFILNSMKNTQGFQGPDVMGLLAVDPGCSAERVGCLERG